jgi:predicted nuclease of restriction endonuclease-like (RecB) superfamily
MGHLNPFRTRKEEVGVESYPYSGFRYDRNRKGTTLPSRPKPAALQPTGNNEAAFSEVLALIAAARERTYQAVNTALIDLYWQVGEYISRKMEAAEWGTGTVDKLAEFIAHSQPGLRGFSRPNLFRMKQFYEAYRQEAIVSALLRQLPWTHHLIILARSKRPEEREFYLRIAIQERWTSRQLERQFNMAFFERAMLSPAKISPTVAETHPQARDVFRDTYVVEFLGLPQKHSENQLHRALLDRMKEFLLELGRDFCFIGSEFPVQVGTSDFALDLLFFHRGLNCLVAFELKVNEFRPEYLGKLNFYLEALDRDVRKEHERPSIGVLLCASKNDEVVEYALSRTLSPALIAEYQTQLPDKRLLQTKLHELYVQNVPENHDPPVSGKRERRTPKKAR